MRQYIDCSGAMQQFALQLGASQVIPTTGHVVFDLRLTTGIYGGAPTCRTSLHRAASQSYVNVG